MKILRVIHSANPKLGGVIEAVRLQQLALKDRGFEVQIVSCDDPNSPWLKNFPDLVALGPYQLSYGYAPRLLPWLRKNADEYDAVIVDGLWQYHSFAVWRVFSGQSTPYYVFPHGMLAPWFKETYRLKHLKKWLYWPWAEYRVLRDARHVIFTSEEERIRTRESFWLYKVREEIAPSGVSKPVQCQSDLVRKFLEKYPDLEGKRIVLFLGRIHKIKGLDLLVKGFSNVAELDECIHLVIAGPDSNGLIPDLQIEAKRLGIEHRITWTGMLHDEMKWGGLYASEVFCLPSHHENFGMVVCEALACGKPVLISNKVNIWREVQDDGAGLVADDSIEGITSMLKTWLEMSDAELGKLKAKTIECYENRFRVEGAIKKLSAILLGNG